MSERNMIKKNTIFYTLKTLFGIIYPLITFPYVSRVLLTDNVGKLNFANSIVSYFSLIASLGITTYAVRECSKVRNDKKELQNVASELISINILCTVISYLMLTILLLISDKLYPYRVLIIIQSLSILFSVLGADWLNTAMEDIKYISVRTIAVQIVSLILMLLFVHRPDDYIVYAIISVVASSGANVINIFHRKKFCNVKITLRMNLKKHIPPIMLMFSMMLSQTIYCNSDITMIGLMCGDYDVGLYSVSVKIYTLVNSVVASVAWVVMPQLSNSFVRKNYIEINKILKYGLGFIVTLGLPCIAGLNVLANEVIFVFAGPEYIEANTSLRILTMALLMSFFGGFIANMIMIPSGREKVALKSCVVSAVVNLLLNLILIPRLGINVAALTTFCAEFVGVLISIRYVEKDIKIEDIKGVFFAPVVGVMEIIAIGFFVKHIFSSVLMVTVITITLSVVTYAVTLMILRNELFMDFIKPMFNKFKRR